MNTVGYIDVVGETKLIMLELAELQKENEQLRAELTTARADAIRECRDAVAQLAVMDVSVVSWTPAWTTGI